MSCRVGGAPADPRGRGLGAGRRRAVRAVVGSVPRPKKNLATAATPGQDRPRGTVTTGVVAGTGAGAVVGPAAIRDRPSARVRDRPGHRRSAGRPMVRSTGLATGLSAGLATAFPVPHPRSDRPARSTASRRRPSCGAAPCHGVGAPPVGSRRGARSRRCGWFRAGTARQTGPGQGTETVSSAPAVRCRPIHRPGRADSTESAEKIMRSSPEAVSTRTARVSPYQRSSRCKDTERDRTEQIHLGLRTERRWGTHTLEHQIHGGRSTAEMPIMEGVVVGREMIIPGRTIHDPICRNRHAEAALSAARRGRTHRSLAPARPSTRARR